MKILIAEDESDIRKLLKLKLEEQQYQVFEAENGIEALKLLRDNDIDLAILDVVMPKLDGLNLLREIRKVSSIPVILLTARGEEMDKVLGFGLGADDYMVKPFSLAELLARVDAQLRRRKVYDNFVFEEADKLQYGELKLDLKACALYKGEMMISLSAKEYKVMEYMMKNPKKVLTKKMLYEAAWEDAYCYDDNTIMVTLSRLRNKIEKDTKKPEYIVTVKGLGYKFDWK